MNATGWYRQRLAPSVIPRFALNTTRPLTLSLGIVAGADRTYLNGQLLGSTPAKSGHAAGGTLAGGPRLYITPRAYVIPPGLLHPAGGPPNVLAVRVVSYGGQWCESATLRPPPPRTPHVLCGKPSLAPDGAVARLPSPPEYSSI